MFASPRVCHWRTEVGPGDFKHSGGPAERLHFGKLHLGVRFGSGYRVQEIHRPYMKRMSQLDDIEQPDVAFTAFGSPNVVPMQAGQFRQPFLRQTLLDSKLADTPSEQQPRVFGIQPSGCRACACGFAFHCFQGAGCTL
jgi:hypothetical protein